MFLDSYRVRFLKLFLLGISFPFTLVACSTEHEPPPYTEEYAQLISTPNPENQAPGEYTYIAWLDGWLIVQYEDSLLGQASGFAFASKLWKLRPDGSDWQSIALPEDNPVCVNSGFEEPTRLPNTQLGYIVRCKYDPNIFVNEIFMMSYDFKTRQATKLLDYPLPSQHSRLGEYSWSPDMSKGIIDDRQGLSERLYWVLPSRWQSLDLEFSRAVLPVWSPDGEQIAFWGAPEQGLMGTDKAKAIFNLYLMAPDGAIRKTLLKGFQYPQSMAWSPDSQWLIFVSRLAETQEDAIWMTDVAQGRLYLLARGSFRRLALSEDGQQVAAIQVDDRSPPRNIITFSIEPILRKLKK